MGHFEGVPCGPVVSGGSWLTLNLKREVAKGEKGAKHKGRAQPLGQFHKVNSTRSIPQGEVHRINSAG